MVVRFGWLDTGPWIALVSGQAGVHKPPGKFGDTGDGYHSDSDVVRSEEYLDRHDAGVGQSDGLCRDG